MKTRFSSRLSRSVHFLSWRWQPGAAAIRRGLRGVAVSAVALSAFMVAPATAPTLFAQQA